WYQMHWPFRGATWRLSEEGTCSTPGFTIRGHSTSLSCAAPKGSQVLVLVCQLGTGQPGPSLNVKSRGARGFPLGDNNLLGA
uniref:Uncharacterized protein n=1 Tax=Calidris pygmaea TaxID=425635 RepID=A0A8C3KC16_9CHAR